MTPITELLDDHQPFHSNLQIERFIVSKSGLTVYGSYRQAVRELWKRRRGLQELYSNRELLLIDIEQMAEQQPKIECRYDARRAEIHIATKRISLDELDRTIQDTEREFLRFWEIASALKDQVGELTQDRRDEMDREMWDHQILAMAATDILSSGHLSPNVIGMLQSLEPAHREEMCQKIFPKKPSDKTTEHLVNWFMETVSMPKLSPTALVGQEDVKRIVQDGAV
jgi:hypothetical protein